MTNNRTSSVPMRTNTYNCSVVKQLDAHQHNESLNDLLTCFDLESTKHTYNLFAQLYASNTYV